MISVVVSDGFSITGFLDGRLTFTEKEDSVKPKAIWGRIRETTYRVIEVACV